MRNPITMRTLTTTIALGVAVVAPAAAAEAREPVTRADAAAAARSLARQAAVQVEGQSATGIEDLTNGAARVDRSRTSVGNYLRYGKFRMGASFALFGTNIVNGELRTLWCVGYVEVARTANGRTRIAPGHLLCPVS
jgi:hypothetical protein